MSNSFSQLILFQVKPDRLDAFELLIRTIQAEQETLPGCISVKYMRRFYTFDGVENGKPPRELTRIVKCVKYYSYLEFDTIENCGQRRDEIAHHAIRNEQRLFCLNKENIRIINEELKIKLTKFAESGWNLIAFVAKVTNGSLFSAVFSPR